MLDNVSISVVEGAAFLVYIIQFGAVGTFLAPGNTRIGQRKLHRCNIDNDSMY